MAILVTRSPDFIGGHHAEHYALFREILSKSGEATRHARRGLASVFAPEVVFFLSIEEAAADFFLTAFLRAFLGLRTVGLLFRFGECVQPRAIRHRVKRTLLKILKQSPSCAVLVIVPFAVDRKLEELGRFGIYDPQMWDKKIAGRDGGDISSAIDVVSNIDKVAGTRKIAVALGGQNCRKGFDYFCRIWSAPGNSVLRREFLFVAGGEVDAQSRPYAAEFEKSGGILVDRLLTHDELSALYARADIVWCCYAPDYDQSSGIFGRSVQYGKPSLVRRGSFIASLADAIGHPVLKLDWNDPIGAANLLLSQDVAPRAADETERCVDEMRSLSLKCLGSSLRVRLQDP